MPDSSVPFDRWGPIVEPPEDEGSYLLLEPEDGEGWTKPPPSDAVRVWQRRPGTPDDDDSNWTTWLPGHDLTSWLDDRGSRFSEWLPVGEEPSWE